VWRLFPRPEKEPRDFLYRVEVVKSQPQVWTLSPRAPQVSALWRCESKEVTPQLRRGDRLEFEVRVNPVVMRQKHRHDVVMDLKKRLRWKEQNREERESEAALVQRALSEWLAARAGQAGFRVERLLAEGYRQDRFARPGGKADKKIELGLCDLQGVVVVEDPELFLATWRKGLGPAKGFGCGLMLIKRAPA
jgi:CRISPR system Cascade subunit CasE